ncbi:UNVERIFIED_CONTAM: hypothetical protein Sradi_2089000 [Sesamum radiatum]|uniref:Retrotransposon gag domain-containing protein n=1 Tax=Sesamum radiatum TaxID=300843 RepID=A0AAW2TJI1_SESRA
MKQQFLQRFFPASRAIHLRKEIYGIRQSNGESLYEYWERFKVLVVSYPHHQFTESLLIQYFYEGLSVMDRRMVDAASGGSLIDKAPEEAQHLISTMAENYRQYGYHTERGVSMVNEDSTETKASLQHLGNQMSQIATSVNQLAAQASGKLPSQTEANPRENVSAMILRSGNEVQPAEPIPTKAKGKEEIHDDTVPHTDKVDSNSVPPPSSNTCALPFPYRISKSREDEHAREILDTFKKMEINILLLDAIKQIPKYAKFFKELCTNKRKLKDKERIIFGKNVSAVINRKLLEKCKDPGLVEDILVKVNDLLFPVDFYILKMGTKGLDNSASVLLGRPFMKTAKTKIDVNEVVHDVLEEELVGTELDLIMDLDEDDECIEFIGEVVAPSLQSILRAPILKLKAFPNYLQSLYLGIRETSSASIFKGLVKEQDELKLYERESREVAKRK